jgi:histidine ammonia-lyase
VGRGRTSPAGRRISSTRPPAGPVRIADGAADPGVAVDAGSALRGVVTALATAGLENPQVLTGPPAEAVQHVGFHALHLTAALDGASSGLARAAVGSVNRLALLTEPVLPAAGQETAHEPQGPVATAVDAAPEPRLFLAGGPPAASGMPPAASGIMVLEYTAGAALGAVRAAAVPAAGQTVEASRGVEQDSTYAPLAADQLAEAIAATRVLVAVELVAAVRALRMAGWSHPLRWKVSGRSAPPFPAPPRTGTSARTCGSPSNYWTSSPCSRSGRVTMVSNHISRTSLQKDLDDRRAVHAAVVHP